MLLQSLLLMLTTAALATEPTPTPQAPKVETPAAPVEAPKAEALKKEEPKVEAPAKPVKALSRRELLAKVLAQGVPAHGFNKILKFIDDNTGKDFVQDTYQCAKFPAESPRTCDEKERQPTSQKLTLKEQNYVVLVDFAMPSTAKRFFLINMKTGAVEKYLAAHGKGSGVNAIAWKFSNIKDSKQTALGMYMTGNTYIGHYGLILRMYGLEKSNDQAYNRDIVLHGATYAAEAFIASKNSETKEPYGRLGVSWGCPAVAIPIAKKIIPLLKGGALIYHDHKDLAEKALNVAGKEVQGIAPPEPPKPIPLPKPRPKEAPQAEPAKEDPKPQEPAKTEQPASPLPAPQEPVVAPKAQAPAEEKIEANDIEGEFDPGLLPIDEQDDN